MRLLATVAAVQAADAAAQAGGTPVEVLMGRAGAAVGTLYQPLAKDQVVVFVAHGQFLKVLATVVLGLPLRDAGGFALGPARAGVFTRRRTGRIALTGWNLPAPAHPATPAGARRGRCR